MFKEVFQKLLFHQQKFQDDILEYEMVKQEREKAVEERMATWQGRFESLFNSVNHVRGTLSKLSNFRLMHIHGLHSNSMLTLTASPVVSLSILKRRKHMSESFPACFTHFNLL